MKRRSFRNLLDEGAPLVTPLAHADGELAPQTGYKAAREALDDGVGVAHWRALESQSA